MGSVYTAAWGNCTRLSLRLCVKADSTQNTARVALEHRTTSALCVVSPEKLLGKPQEGCQLSWRKVQLVAVTTMAQLAGQVQLCRWPPKTGLHLFSSSAGSL